MNTQTSKLIILNKISNQRGGLTFVENNRHIPFEIKRVYYAYDMPKGSVRGGHAHKALEQVVIPLSGSFDVILDDGLEKKTFHLDKPNIGLYIPYMIWRDIINFSEHAVMLVLASDFYKETDYYRDYQDFLSSITNTQQEITNA